MKIRSNGIFSIGKRPIVLYQYIFPKAIPIIIVNFNQLYYLKKQIAFLIDRGFRKITIIDNNSTYPPLLKYYKSIDSQVNILYRQSNGGHMVFFEDRIYLKIKRSGFYVLSDPDIVPNPQLPRNFIRKMIRILYRHYLISNKFGFALKLDNLPDFYSNKTKVINWEQQFWQKELSKDIFMADIDTSFALYKPGHKPRQNSLFLAGIRLGGCFTAEHGGWYIDSNNLTEEQKYYNQTANT